MDLWVVAAITGAGYAAKYLQNFSRDKEGFSGLTSTSSVSKKPDSSSLIPHFEENAAFLQKSAYRFGESMQYNSPTVETASTSEFEGEISYSYGEGFEASARAMGTLRDHRRRQNLRGRGHNHMQYLMPLNSLESCLMAQICNEHSEMEDRVLTPVPSTCVPALRPFVVSDGARVISRTSFDSCSVQVRDDKKKLHSKAFTEINETVLGGIPQLPERGTGDRSKESNLKKGKDQVEKLSSIREMPNEMQMSSQGPPSGVALFCLGVSIGVMYNTLANKREVTKLKDVLKQTENLVQDLKEELEMKDSLTVNELVSVSEVDAFPYEQESSIDNKKPIVAHFQSDSQKAPENLESMNRIEAELEAELERLELNMKGSTLPAKSLDDDDEIDPDIVAELIQGEFRKPTSDPCHDSGSSSSTTPCSPKQAVSPRDLSLRLHQVIQSRLEQRIMELEVAIEKSRERVKHLESEQGLSHNDVSSSSSSSRGSPITIEEERELPLVMNLSGEALDAYNEAFEELNKINGSKYDERNSVTCKESQEEQPFHRSMFEQREMFSFDEDDDEDNDTTLLIKQIVEKTRQGSSVILHAHKAMVSLDSNEKWQC